MGIAKSWKSYRATLQLRSDEQERLLREAFYAGAEAVLKEPIGKQCFELKAEIDHFRSHK